MVDSHPDTTHTLRIDQPFPALEKYARELDMDNMDSMEHSHVPWVIILVRAGCKWKDSVRLALSRREADSYSMQDHCLEIKMTAEKEKNSKN